MTAKEIHSVRFYQSYTLLFSKSKDHVSSGCLPEVKSDRKFLNCQPKKWSWSLFTDLVNTKLKQWIVFFACSDWLLKLRICSAIHLQAKPNSCKLPEKWNTVCCHNKQRNFTNK